ncbi:hypothetical protein N7532_006397 [Penicillium argentinense]|uniref:Uncharacterized protein n=1 Tax=Penicillium argentinense TaxID=1131581 RepID=A0A9W9FFV0_9EURO|nr:uncharacterized protein N7532_006397 [Penicillium argentinense]KAJ5099396.1 hypothetical protein N7532_006397 [Penicillium argentinense]
MSFCVPSYYWLTQRLSGPVSYRGWLLAGTRNSRTAICGGALWVQLQCVRIVLPIAFRWISVRGIFSRPGGDWVANFFAKKIRESGGPRYACLLDFSLLSSLSLRCFGLVSRALGYACCWGGYFFCWKSDENYTWDELCMLWIVIRDGSCFSAESAIAWIWTWFINDFITTCGVTSVFMTVAAIHVAIY